MKNCLITGSSRGIGKATAKYFKERGYNVIINYNKSEKEALELANELGATAYKFDVSDSLQVNEAFSKIEKEFGGVDVLINNAGIALNQKLLIDTSEEEFDKIFAVDVKGVYNCTKRALGYMLKEGGSIVNVSSVFGIYGGSCEVIYSSAKSAVVGFTRSLAEELEFSNVKINCVCFGIVDTEMNGKLTDEDKLEFAKSLGESEVATVEDAAKVIYDTAIRSESGKVVKAFTGNL